MKMGNVEETANTLFDAILQWLVLWQLEGVGVGVDFPKSQISDRSKKVTQP